MAKESCFGHKSVLVGLNSEQYIMELMKSNTYYWLDIHRAYAATPARTTLSSACLAVTRVNDSIYFDPDNCDKKKFFLSCYEAYAKASGYFCQQGAHSQLYTCRCSARDRTGRYCRVTSASSRQVAKESCFGHKGVLEDLNSEQHIMELMQSNRYVATSSHLAIKDALSQYQCSFKTS